jgi:pimeloyl-ACP methyl ester carboxylesterase
MPVIPPNASAPKLLPQSGPWSSAEIDENLGEVARRYLRAGGSRGNIRAELVSLIRDGLRGIEAGGISRDVVSVRLDCVTEYRNEGAASISWDLSGIVFLPTGSPGEQLLAPILSLQHGTQVNRNNAPSKFDPNPDAFLNEPLRPETDEALLNFLECEIGASLAGMGYIVVMPDYPGFGDNSAIHPYVHSSLGDCVRDAVKATIALTSSDQWKDRISWNRHLYLIGYSEGGYATMVGAKSLTAMPGEAIQVTAAVPCDGAYDLSGTMVERILDGTAELNPHYVPYTFIGYESIYGTSLFNSLSPFKTAYAVKLPCLFDGNHWTIQMYKAIPRAGLFSQRYAARDVLNDAVMENLEDTSSPLFRAIRDNDAFRGWKPDFAMRIVHCKDDDVVPVENAIAAYEAFGGRTAVNVNLVYVQPVEFASASADVHTRAFASAMMDGLSYICRTESAIIAPVKTKP